ncbi:MAG TPA: right-handed parallel beta-helix repeat-containing protein [Candidatus Dependentiae bacterium]|nr:right-handed parallel beta-helix repeat-containing protein [Candidatus Dependentiae bacterium]HRQ62695.1 right-handed parallel beta-helix repeat-containing protein [Candidatus Dependentiae bacterium]
MKCMLSRLFILLFVFSFGSTCVAAITFVNPQPGENIHGLTYRIGTEVDIIASKACIIESLVDELDCSAGDAMICSKLEIIESKIDEILDTIECDEIINLQDVLDVGTFVITHEGRYCFVGSDVLLTTTLDCAIEVQADNVVLNFANLSIDGNNLANQFVCFHNNKNVSIIGGRISHFTENVFYVDNSTNVTITKSHICDNEVAIYVNDSQKIALDGLDICNTSSAGIIIINTQDTIIRETLLMNDASITVTLQVAIDISGSNDVLLDDVRVINFHNGMLFESTTNIVCTNCLSKENINGGYIVFGPGAKDIIFSSCTALSNEGAGFRINGCNVTCKDCCAMHNDAGFIFDADTLAALLDGCYGMGNNIGLCIEIDVQNLCVVNSYFNANLEIDIKGTSSSTTFASEKIIQDILAGPVRIVLDQTNFDAGETVTIRVPGVVVITEDIIWTVTHKFAIVIEADNVTINLGTNTINGMDQGFGAICWEGVRNTRILNGFLNNFIGNAIKASLSSKSIVQNICGMSADGQNVYFVFQNVEQVTVKEVNITKPNGGGCIRCEDCECVTVQDSKVTGGVTNEDLLVELRGVRAAIADNIAATIIGDAVGVAATIATGVGSTYLSLKSNKITGAVEGAKNGIGMLADGASFVSSTKNLVTNTNIGQNVRNSRSFSSFRDSFGDTNIASLFEGSSEIISRGRDIANSLLGASYDDSDTVSDEDTTAESTATALSAQDSSNILFNGYKVVNSAFSGLRGNNSQLVGQNGSIDGTSLGPAILMEDSDFTIDGQRLVHNFGALRSINSSGRVTDFIADETDFKSIWQNGGFLELQQAILNGAGEEAYLGQAIDSFSGRDISTNRTGGGTASILVDDFGDLDLEGLDQEDSFGDALRANNGDRVSVRNSSARRSSQNGYSFNNDDIIDLEDVSDSESGESSFRFGFTNLIDAIGLSSDGSVGDAAIDLDNAFQSLFEDVNIRHSSGDAFRAGGTGSGSFLSLRNSSASDIGGNAYFFETVDEILAYGADAERVNGRGIDASSGGSRFSWRNSRLSSISGDGSVWDDWDEVYADGIDYEDIGGHVIDASDGDIFGLRDSSARQAGAGIRGSNWTEFSEEDSDIQSIGGIGREYSNIGQYRGRNLSSDDTGDDALSFSEVDDTDIDGADISRSSGNALSASNGNSLSVQNQTLADIAGKGNVVAIMNRVSILNSAAENIVEEFMHGTDINTMSLRSISEFNGGSDFVLLNGAIQAFISKADAFGLDGTMFNLEDVVNLAIESVNGGGIGGDGVNGKGFAVSKALLDALNIEVDGNGIVLPIFDDPFEDPLVSKTSITNSVIRAGKTAIRLFRSLI